MVLHRNTKKSVAGLFKNLVKLGWVFLLCLLIVPAGCNEKGKPEGPYSENRLIKELNSLFLEYDFKEKTPKDLQRLHQTSTDGKSMVAAVKFYLIARTYMDWLLTAIIQNDSDLLRGLFANLNLDSNCCPKDKRCIRSRRIDLKSSCTEKLQKKLHAQFQKLHDLEGKEGSYTELAKKAQKLLQALLMDSNTRGTGYRSVFSRLSKAKDPVGNRASLLILVEGASRLSAVSVSPPSRAGYLMSFLAPHWCEEPIERIRPEMSDQEIRRILIPSECGYKCEEISVLPKQTAEAYKTVVKKCSAVFLGFDQQQEEKRYFTQQSFVAFRALNMLVAQAAHLQRDETDPLLKKHSELLLLLHKQLWDLRVALPYPPVMATQDSVIEPPIVRTVENMEIYAPIHIVMDEKNYYVGIMPYAGISRKEARLLDVEEGYILPGNAQLIPKAKGPLVSLQAMIKRARITAAHVRPPEWKGERHSSWISIYADHETNLENLKTLLGQLSKVPNPPIEAVQLVFVNSPVGGAASQGATLHMGKPPKGETSAMKILPGKDGRTNWEILPIKGEEQEEPEGSAPVALVIEEAQGNLENLIRSIVQARQKHGPASIYWEI